MTELFVFCGAVMLALFVLMILRELRRDAAVPIALTMCVLCFMYVLPRLTESVRFVRELSVYLEKARVDTILRALGIAYLTETESELCRAAGEASLGRYIELAGRAEMILLCLPLFRELTELTFL